MKKKVELWQLLLVVGTLIMIVGIMLLVSANNSGVIVQQQSIQKLSTPIVIKEEPKVVVKFESDSQRDFAKKLYKGAVFFKVGIKEEIANYFNSSRIEKDKEWALCFYGFSYDIEQDFRGYFVENLTLGAVVNNNATSVEFDCNLLYLGYDTLELIGDSHAHLNQYPGIFSPSFEDTTGWDSLHKQHEKYDFHCIHNNNLEFACYSWMSQPVLHNFR